MSSLASARNVMSIKCVLGNFNRSFQCQDSWFLFVHHPVGLSRDRLLLPAYSISIKTRMHVSLRPEDALLVILMVLETWILPLELQYGQFVLRPIFKRELPMH